MFESSHIARKRFLVGSTAVRTTTLAIAVALFVVGTASPVLADGGDGADESAPWTSELEDALFGGDWTLNLRLRAEISDMDGFQTSQAYTERLRIGYGTKEYNGWSLYVELEDIHAADDDRYNAAGTNGQPTRTVIADPEDTELNQGFIKYNWKEASTTITVGRQRITLDDHRFVGNVGWRQNEQTYDATTIVSTFLENYTIVYAYIWDIHRVFGPDAGLDLDSDSHALNISRDTHAIGKITVFAYLLDVGGIPAAPLFSSDTYGLRLAGDTPLNDEVDLEYIFSYAHQSDANGNPVDYDAEYYLAELKVTRGEDYVGVAYEHLGSDGGAFGFQTPLATGHKFNGWADVFLVTPAAGLQDVYGYVGTTLPCGAKGKIVYHRYYGDAGRNEFGDEIDVQVTKKLSDHVLALAKYATFDGKGAFSDIRKFWLEANITY